MQTNGVAVHLVACVSKKQVFACAARDLYASDWFRKARRYAEASGTPWFILSAEHGLLKPEQVIAPYERTLNNMRSTERSMWSDRVVAQLTRAVPDLKHVEFLAGATYREYLAEHLDRLGVTVSIPMEGLRIGEQLRWFAQNDANRTG